MEQLGIVGAGPGGADLLKTFLAIPGIKVIGIADPNPQSPGLVLAREHRIFTTSNYHDIINKPGKKIIFDATGVPKVAKDLAELADETNIVICPEVGKLIWTMVDVKEETNRALVKESDTLLSFIEEGLEHLEVINNEHGKTLQEAVEEIKRLAKITSESQVLIQETAGVMQIIRNVADQTRILGINASIESARAGEHGRGFGVVADSIHELSASSIRSVQSATHTMDNIRQALQNISDSVEQVVGDIQRIEEHQMRLTHELHSSLEEMSQSANKLGEIAGYTKKQR